MIDTREKMINRKVTFSSSYQGVGLIICDRQSYQKMTAINAFIYSKQHEENNQIALGQPMDC